MTTHDMTDEEINRAVAIIAGWKDPNPKHYPLGTRPDWMHRPEWDGIKHSATSTPLPIPRFSESWDAIMPEVLKRTSEGDNHWIATFGHYLYSIKKASSPAPVFPIWDATPRELCLAFIETEREVNRGC